MAEGQLRELATIGLEPTDKLRGVVLGNNRASRERRAHAPRIWLTTHGQVLVRFPRPVPHALLGGVRRPVEGLAIDNQHAPLQRVHTPS